MQWIESLKHLKTVLEVFGIIFEVDGKIKLSIWRLVVLGVVVTGAIFWGRNAFTATKEPQPSTEPPTTIETTMPQVSPGELRTFGTYDSKRISWQVLDIQDGQALLVSERALVKQPYNSDYGWISWEECSLRNEWLNGTFLNNSFTAKEREAIVGSISLLSIQEVQQYFPNEADRICEAIPGAASEGDNGVKEVEGKIGVCWWLRGTEGKALDAPYVNFEGKNYMNYVGNDYQLVRPAMWVDLNKIENQWEKP